MNFFNRLSFHHRIFVLVGLFSVVSIGVMWLFIRPMYEHQVVEERTTVVQQLQHFAVRSIDEKLGQWIDITHYLAWNLQHNPGDVDVLMRQQIAYDTSIIQIIVSSPDLADEFVATSSAYPQFMFRADAGSWIVSERDSSIAVLWTKDSLSEIEIFGVQKRFSVDNKPLFLTLLSDSRNMLQQLEKLPIGGTFAVQVGNEKGFIYNNSKISFPQFAESWKNITVMHDVTVESTEWKMLVSSFRTVPMYLMIGIPADVILRPVQNLFVYSTAAVLLLTSAVFVLAWIFSRQLSKPITQLVRDVERLSVLDFSQSVSIPDLREMANIAHTIENMRIVLERYQRINVEKIIFEEWKNKFFLSHSEDCICITDGNDAFTFMNDRFVQIKNDLGKIQPVNNKQDMLSHPNIEISKETSRDEVTGSTAIAFHQKEIMISIPDAEPKYFRLHDVTIAREAENLGSLLVLHDLTTERMIEKMKTEMMNFIVHELRNPLNSIMGFASFMVDEPDMDPAERSEYVRIIQDSSRTMNQLVNRFLEVQRLESRSVEYHKEPTDLTDIAKRVCDSQKPQLQSKSIDLKFTAEENIPHTLVSPDLMREAFLNLVSNAIKYGDEHRTIEVEMKKSADSVVFVITDHGYGISSEDQEKLFSKFFRVTSNKKAANQLGTGLGLAHVKEVMRFHKGNVTLESNESIGCRFTLTIPIV